MCLIDWLGVPIMQQAILNFVLAISALLMSGGIIALVYIIAT